MKSPILWLPSILTLSLAALLSTRTQAASSPASQADRDTVIRELRQELKVLSDRLERLEAKSHHELPRGGLSSNKDVPANSHGTSASILLLPLPC